jgi:hypothetical protein
MSQRSASCCGPPLMISTFQESSCGTIGDGQVRRHLADVLHLQPGGRLQFFAVFENLSPRERDLRPWLSATGAVLKRRAVVQRVKGIARTMFRPRRFDFLSSRAGCRGSRRPTSRVVYQLDGRTPDARAPHCLCPESLRVRSPWPLRRRVGYFVQDKDAPIVVATKRHLSPFSL